MKPSGPHRRANPTADSSTAMKRLTVCVRDCVFFDLLHTEDQNSHSTTDPGSEVRVRE